MGAPAVIPTPKKSYVAVNSMKSDRSIPPTLCDLGRVSNMAAAATLPRSSNFVVRNNSNQNIRCIPHRKRPISELLGYSNSTTTHNPTAALSITNQPNSMDYHANRNGTHQNQQSILPSATPSSVETIPVRKHDSTSQAKRIRLDSVVTTSRVVSSPKLSTPDNQKNISVSELEKAQMNLSIQCPNSQSTNLTLQKPNLMPAQLTSHETKAEHHEDQHHRIHSQNTTQLPNQQAVPLLTPGMVKCPNQVSHSLRVQLQQQNQQLDNSTQLPNQQAVSFRNPGMVNLPTQVSDSVGVQLQQQTLQLSNTTQLPNQQTVPLLTPGVVKYPTQVSHSIGVQLQQENQQLRSENVLLQKQLSLFRQLMRNPQRLNQILTRLEQRVH